MQKISKNTVYSPAWQLLRMQLKGNWTNNIASNLDCCSDYLGDHKDLSRVWRVLNMLNAVRMGFHGMGIVGSPTDKMLVEYRDKLSKIHTQLIADGAQLTAVTDEQVLQEWDDIPEHWQHEIIQDLSIRYIKSGKSANRGDLKWFLNLIGVNL